MKKTHLLYTIILFTTLWGCKKDCDETYTISGRMLNGTSGEPYADTSFGIRVVEEKNFGGINRETLGRNETDSDGYFSISYQCTDIGDEILLSMGNQEARLPKNQNLTDYIIYFSPEGSFNIHVKLKAPLQPDDTLFVATPLDTDIFNDSIRIDTFINPQEGFFRNIRVPNTSFNIFWGRSSNSGAGKFTYIKKDNGFDKNTPREYVNPSGDPYVDKVELEF